MKVCEIQYGCVQSNRFIRHQEGTTTIDLSKNSEIELIIEILDIKGMIPNPFKNNFAS